MIFPDSWKRLFEISTLTYGCTSERALVRGAIVFPEYYPDKESFHGALCVGAETTDKSKISFFEFDYFSEYNDFLADKFADMYKKYGVNKYYYRMDSDGLSRVDRFTEELHRRKSKGLTSVYPVLVPLRFSTDYTSMYPLLSSIGKIEYSDNPEIEKNLLAWTEGKKDYDSCPPLIRSMAVLCSGFDSDTAYYANKEKSYLSSLPNGGYFQ